VQLAEVNPLSEAVAFDLTKVISNVQLAEVNPLSEAVAFDLTKAIQKFTEANAITLGVTQNVQLDRRE
jgi:ribosomal protein S17